MTKIRVHELAKELSISSKDLLEKLAENNIDAKSHMSCIEEKDADKIKSLYKKPSANKKSMVTDSNLKNDNNKKSDIQANSEKTKGTDAAGKTKSNQIADGNKMNYKQNKQQSHSKFDRNFDSNKQKNNNKTFNNNQKGKEAYSNKNFSNRKINEKNTQGGITASSDANKQTKNASNKTIQKSSSTHARKPQYESKAHAYGNDMDRFTKKERIKDTKMGKENSERKEKKDIRDKDRDFRDKKGSKKNRDVSEDGITKDYKGKKNQKERTDRSKSGENTNIENKTKDIPSKPVEIEETIVIKELADKIKISTAQIISKLIGLGVMANQNQAIDFDTASLISEEFNVKLVKKEPELPKNPEEIFQEGEKDSEDNLVKRPPVVTVMGHVDHGKTSLLDAIKNTHVTRGEAGGITQHIGAYMVDVQGNKVTFLDTPGHEAFTAMRSRGAQVTDIAVLVVAADDGVMPQTLEAISHAKAADVPIIVAINKMDKPEANPDRVKQELVENGLLPEDWGGETITVPISAKANTGIDDLLEMILLVAEMQELKANANRNAIGTVIEAQLDKGKGPMATVLVQKGTLNVGDYAVSGTSQGRIRAMFDDKSRRVKKAGPSVPVVILGLSTVPNSGDIIYATADEKKARSFAEANLQEQKESMIKSSKVSLDDLFEKIKEGEMKDLNLIIKADVKGSVEALHQSLQKLSTDEVKINIIHTGAGGITESDIMLASASNAIIIGFNVRPNLNALESAKKMDVDVRTYRVIYEIIEDIEAAVKGMHAPKIVEEVLGRCEVRQTFKLPNGMIIAGIYVQSGKIQRNAKVKILRDDIVIHDGPIASLKRYKDDVRELSTGFEGGVGIENFKDIKEGDIIEAYVLKEVRPE